MIKIFIDADACPVKEEVYKVSIRNKLEVLIVSNGGIRPHPNTLIKSIFVMEVTSLVIKYFIAGKKKDMVL